MPQGILSWKQIQFTIFLFALANEEPRGAWKILAGIGFGADSPTSSALRADAFFRGNFDSVLLRYVLDKVRNYFSEHPEEEI